MNSGDGRGLETVRLLPQRLQLGRIRQQLLHPVERRRQNGIVGAHLFSANAAAAHRRRRTSNRIDRRSQMHFAAARLDVWPPRFRKAATAAPREYPCVRPLPTSETNRETPARRNGTDTRSSSSFSALTSTGAQKRSIACCVCPWRSSQEHESFRHCRWAARAPAPAWRARWPACPSDQAPSTRGTRARHETAQAARRASASTTSAGKDECDLVVPANLLLDAEAAIEIDQVGAAAEQHVLAVVHHFARAGQFVR